MARAARVALALGGGGARGYAHIGVIQVLEERGYEIASIAGTSMGAVVGGLHAAGSLGAYTEWVRTLTQRDVIRLLDPAVRAPGVIRAEKVLAKVTDLLGGATIEQLPFPFTAVATDLLTGKEVWFQQGPVSAALRASFAIPSFIAPVALSGRLLADGGLVNPVPVAATAASTADLTVAVSLSELHVVPETARADESAGEPTTDEPVDRLRHAGAPLLESELMRTISSWLTGGRDAAPMGDERGEQGENREDDGPQPEEELFGSLPSGLRTLDVMQLSLAALQRVVTRYRLAGYPPDLLITVPKSSARVLDFHRADELIALGRQRAVDALDRQAPAP